MGGGTWSKNEYTAKTNIRSTSHTPTFAYSDAIDSGKVKAATHDKMSPKGNRESRDSSEHPESRAVAVLFDVTGSMREVPKIIQGNLPTLMSLLIAKSYLAHPQILVGAIGDAYSDVAPLQLGQFESDIRIDEHLTNIYLEGNGGGQNKESYELGMYYMARHVSTDCWEKRGDKGYLFIFGDEHPYPKVNCTQVKNIIGDTLAEPLSVESIVEELLEKWEVFFVIPKLTAHYGEYGLKERWQQLLGQNVLELSDPAGVSELIATQIGVFEGASIADVTEDMLSEGTTASTAKSVVNAIVSTKRKSGVVKGSGKPNGLVST